MKRFTLSISDLSMYLRIGVYDWENLIRQRVLISFQMELLWAAGEDFCDYDVLCKKILNHFSDKTYLLLEEFVYDLGEWLMEHGKALSCSVSVMKPLALGGRAAVSVSSCFPNV